MRGFRNLISSNNREDTAMTTYSSDIALGERYRDDQTGLEGIATSITFHQHACERVVIEFVNEHDGKLTEYVFDAPRLTNIETGRKATSEKTGGPDHRVTGGLDLGQRR